MPTQTHKRPGLRPAVEALLASCAPLREKGGLLPLARVVEATTGGALKPAVMKALESRGDLVFERQDGRVVFRNMGPKLQIQLRRFDLIVPPRLAGQVEEISGGIAFDFDATDTFRASKFLLSVNLERLEVTSEKIWVHLQGGVFDQCIELV